MPDKESISQQNKHNCMLRPHAIIVQLDNLSMHDHSIRARQIVQHTLWKSYQEYRRCGYHILLQQYIQKVFYQ